MVNPQKAFPSAYDCRQRTRCGSSARRASGLRKLARKRHRVHFRALRPSTIRAGHAPRSAHFERMGEERIYPFLRQMAKVELVLRHRGFDEYMTLAVYRGENAGGIDVKKVYVVDLTKEEKSELLKLVGKGEVRARKMNRAHILLLAEEDRTDKDIAKALHTSLSTVEQSSGRAGAW